MELLWRLSCIFLNLQLLELCDGLPLDLQYAAQGVVQWEWNTGILTLIGAACVVLVVAGCLCCQNRKGFEEFNDANITIPPDSSGDVEMGRDPGMVNPMAVAAQQGSEFTIFRPLSPPHYNNNIFAVQPTRPQEEIVNENQPTSTVNAKRQTSSNTDPIDVRDWYNGTADFPRNKLKYLRELGHGWFGKVIEGEALGAYRDAPPEEARLVVVRVLEPTATRRERDTFLQEALPYRDSTNCHVLALLGRCLNAPSLLLIQEHCSNGDLKQFLRDSGRVVESNEQKVSQLRISWEVTDALQYLHQKGISHCDLAARNCQVSSDFSIRLGDYGLAVQKYPQDYYPGTPPVSVRWCAPENIVCTQSTIQPKQVTCTGNIWSLGVLLWEISSWGAQPYNNLTDDEVVSYVLGAPPHTPLQEPPKNTSHTHYLYQLARLCCSPMETRPPISQVHSMLTYLLNSTSKVNDTDAEFEDRWSTFKPNTIVKIDNHRPDQESAIVETTFIENQLNINVHTTVPDNCNLTVVSYDPKLSPSTESTTNSDSFVIKEKSASLTNLHGSLENLDCEKSENKPVERNPFENKNTTDISECSNNVNPFIIPNLTKTNEALNKSGKPTKEGHYESWLENIVSQDPLDSQYIEGLSQAMKELDSALAQEPSSSSGSDTSHQPSPGPESWNLDQRNGHNSTKQTESISVQLKSDTDSGIETAGQSYVVSDQSLAVLDNKNQPEMKSLSSEESGEDNNKIDFSDDSETAQKIMFKLGPIEDNTGGPIENNQQSSSSSETEDETWKKQIELGAYSEKVRQKSKSVADLMILTHIDLDTDTDTETPLPSLDYRVNCFKSTVKNNLENSSKLFGSEGNVNVVHETFEEELQRLRAARRDSLLFVPAQPEQSTDVDSKQDEEPNAQIDSNEDKLESNNTLDVPLLYVIKASYEDITTLDDSTLMHVSINVANKRRRVLFTYHSSESSSDECDECTVNEVSEKCDDTIEETTVPETCDKRDDENGNEKIIPLPAQVSEKPSDFDVLDITKTFLQNECSLQSQSQDILVTSTPCVNKFDSTFVHDMSNISDAESNSEILAKPLDVSNDNEPVNTINQNLNNIDSSQLTASLVSNCTIIPTNQEFNVMRCEIIPTYKNVLQYPTSLNKLALYSDLNGCVEPNEEELLQFSTNFMQEEIEPIVNIDNTYVINEIPTLQKLAQESCEQSSLAPDSLEVEACHTYSVKQIAEEIVFEIIENAKKIIAERLILAESEKSLTHDSYKEFLTPIINSIILEAEQKVDEILYSKMCVLQEELFEKPCEPIFDSDALSTPQLDSLEFNVNYDQTSNSISEKTVILPNEITEEINENTFVVSESPVNDETEMKNDLEATFTVNDYGLDKTYVHDAEQTFFTNELNETHIVNKVDLLDNKPFKTYEMKEKPPRKNKINSVQDNSLNFSDKDNFLNLTYTATDAIYGNDQERDQDGFSLEGGWFLHPQGSGVASSSEDLESPPTSDNSYVGFNFDEECVTALRNELAAKLPHAQGPPIDPDPEDWENEAGPSEPHDEVILRYNVFATPLSPIPEESEEYEFLTPDITRDGSDSDCGWSAEESVTETPRAGSPEAVAVSKLLHKQTLSVDSCCSNDTLFNIEDINGSNVCDAEQQPLVFKKEDANPTKNSDIKTCDLKKQNGENCITDLNKTHVKSVNDTYDQTKNFLTRLDKVPTPNEINLALERLQLHNGYSEDTINGECEISDVPNFIETCNSEYPSSTEKCETEPSTQELNSEYLSHSKSNELVSGEDSLHDDVIIRNIFEEEFSLKHKEPEKITKSDFNNLMESLKLNHTQNEEDLKNDLNLNKTYVKNTPTEDVTVADILLELNDTSELKNNESKNSEIISVEREKEITDCEVSPNCDITKHFLENEQHHAELELKFTFDKSSDKNIIQENYFKVPSISLENEQECMNSYDSTTDTATLQPSEIFNEEYSQSHSETAADKTTENTSKESSREFDSSSINNDLQSDQIRSSVSSAEAVSSSQLTDKLSFGSDTSPVKSSLSPDAQTENTDTSSSNLENRCMQNKIIERIFMEQINDVSDLSQTVSDSLTRSNITSNDNTDQKINEEVQDTDVKNEYEISTSFSDPDHLDDACEEKIEENLDALYENLEHFDDVTAKKFYENIPTSPVHDEVIESIYENIGKVSQMDKEQKKSDDFLKFKNESMYVNDPKNNSLQFLKTQLEQHSMVDSDNSRDDDLYDKVCSTEDVYNDLTDIRFSGPADSQLMSTSFSDPHAGSDEQDWDSGSDSRSSSSGEFVWKEGEHEANVRVLHAPYEELPLDQTIVPMDSIAEEESSSSGEEGEGLEFIPSAWDAQATPTKSALRSPDKKSKEKSERKKRGVWFKKQKYHCVYEYPREPDLSPPEWVHPCGAGIWGTATATDLSNFADDGSILITDWELDTETMLDENSGQLCPSMDLEYDDELSTATGASRFGRRDYFRRPGDLYRLANVATDVDFALGSSATDDDFYISSSARPFQTYGLSSQFFPGQLHVQQPPEPAATATTTTTTTIKEEIKNRNIIDFANDLKKLHANLSDLKTVTPAFGFTTPDSGVEDMTPASISDNSEFSDTHSTPEEVVLVTVPSLKELAEQVAGKLKSGCVNNNKDVMGGLRHTRDRLKLDLPPSPNSFTSSKVFNLEPAVKDSTVSVPTFTTFGKTRFSIKHVETPTDEQCSISSVPINDILPDEDSGETNNKHILIECKRKSIEMVRGEASLLDSADEDSGIESSTNATLERQT